MEERVKPLFIYTLSIDNRNSKEYNGIYKAVAK